MSRLKFSFMRFREVFAVEIEKNFVLSEAQILLATVFLDSVKSFASPAARAEALIDSGDKSNHRSRAQFVAQDADRACENQSEPEWKATQWRPRPGKELPIFDTYSHLDIHKWQPRVRRNNLSLSIQ